MEIGGLGPAEHVFQMQGVIDGCAFDRDASALCSDAGKHFAADFPCVMAGVPRIGPRVGDVGGGKAGANGVDSFAGHGGSMANDGTK